MSIQAITILILAYLFGSIPFGLIISRLFGKVDIRNAGSGNIGATNVYRVMGKSYGIVTLILDMVKGGLFVTLARVLTHSEILEGLAGLSAFLGHLYPLYLRFQGGKGVATFMGVFIVLSPFALLADLVIFTIVAYRTHYISLASLFSAIFLPIFLLGFAYPKVYIILSLVMGFFIILRHRENIQRLKYGRENKIEFK